MESQKPKIALYVKRPFGDKLNATMDFIKENWKPMLKFCTYQIAEKHQSVIYPELHSDGR